MTPTSYTYSVIHYTHDPSAGESLNIGVVLFSPNARFLGAKFQQNYERLSKTFSGFNGENYRRSIRRFEAAIGKMSDEWTGSMFFETDIPKDLGTVLSMLWPDPGLSYGCGPVLAGISEEMNEAIVGIFDRMVTSQYDTESGERRSDQDVWSVYNKSFLRHSITRAFQPKVFETDAFDVKFEHTFKNGAWHALQPISLDYSKPEGMKNKVTRLLGNAVVLEDNAELSTLYLLLGPPKSQDQLPAYRKAKEILRKRIRVNHQIIEEDQAERFADTLATYMREHGVLDHLP